MDQKQRNARDLTIAQHRDKLAEEHGLVGHPKLGLLYQKAWELGHSAGYGEVETYFADLAELIR